MLVDNINIVQHDHHHLQVVKRQLYDIMHIHHLVRQHVVINQQAIHLIQVIERTIIVIGVVMQHTIKILMVNVRVVQGENILPHVQQVVVIVQINQRIHIIQVVQQVIIVVGHVIHDIRRAEIHVLNLVARHDPVIRIQLNDQNVHIVLKMRGLLLVVT